MQFGIAVPSPGPMATPENIATLAQKGEEMGFGIITDGEIRRESYSNRFATALDGIDLEQAGQVMSGGGVPTPVPRVVGPIRRIRPVQVRDVEFLRANTDHRIKVTVPGPFTLAQQAQNDYYSDRESLAMDYAICVNLEVKALFAARALDDGARLRHEVYAPSGRLPEAPQHGPGRRHRAAIARLLSLT